jgi:hypothetical protein
MRASLKMRTFRLRTGGVECDANGLRVGGAQLRSMKGVSPRPVLASRASTPALPCSK